MKYKFLLLTFFLFIIFGGSYTFYTYNQIKDEESFLKQDLQYRTNVLAENIAESFKDRLFSEKYIEQSFSKLISSEKLIDLFFFNKEGLLIVHKNNASSSVRVSTPVILSKLINSENFSEKQEYGEYTRFIYKLSNNDNEVVGYLVINQDSSYVNDYIIRFWKNSLNKFLSVFFGMLIVLFVLVYFLVYRPSQIAVDVIRNIRKSIDTSVELPDSFLSFSQPLRDEVYLTIKSFITARNSAREEADLRQKIIDSPWTQNRLGQFFKQRMSGRYLVVVSNREPYVHKLESKNVIVEKTPHGLFTALDSVLRSTGGTWIAHGSGNKDKDYVDLNDKVRVPAEEPAYDLKRIWLTEEEVLGHYVGFSNEALFPLCLMTHNRPIFRDKDWEMYKNVNQKFANAVIDEIKGKEKPVVFIQDLHFALLPRMIKEIRPDAEVILFWHHPWPTAEQFSICPWNVEILTGMLESDLLGFHIQLFCNNFLDTIKKELEAKIDFENMSVTHKNKNTLIRAFPISIPFVNSLAKPIDTSKFNFNDILGLKIDGIKIILGVDRLDYTKGLMERLRGIEEFFNKYPDHIKKVVFVQVAAPSREKVKKYREYTQDVLSEVERINKKLQTSSWKPIIFLHKQYGHEVLNPLYAIADACLITSLHDGMNLVAKEYVSQQEDKGVLILSKFAGASKELSSAIIINPYNSSEIAESIDKALKMTTDEKRSRLIFMRNKISQYNVYRWVADILNTLLNKY